MAISIEMLTGTEVYKALESRPDGLKEHEVAERLNRFGPNTIGDVRRKPLWVQLFRNFIHLMAVLLWIAGLVALIARMPQLAISIWAVNLINGAFSFWQEYKAEKATEAMRRLLPVFAQVLREGEVKRVPAHELVSGDILILSEGDRISADARLVVENDLRVDQSTLTGESVQIRKVADATRAHSMTRIEIPNIVFTGTTIVSGTGMAVVFATGMETEFGKIAGFTQSLGEAISPLQKEMQRLTKLVTAIAVSMGGVFFLLATVLAGLNLAESFLFGMGMIVAFVPEGLLPTVTLSLAMGVQRMARRNALIKRLSSVETLGSTSIICTDKTGTLTQNEMTVRSIWLGERSLSVTGTGYTPEGQILEDNKPLDLAREKDLHHLILTMALCNNARLLPPEGESQHWTILGDPTEGALRVLALKAGLDTDAEEGLTPRLREFPFESRRKRMSTLHASGGQTGILYVKGAPKEILGLCTRVLLNGSEEQLGDSLRQQIMDTNDAYARSGLRVLAAAQRIFPDNSLQRSGRSKASTAETVERELTFLGLTAMMDPPRPEVADAVIKCHRAGIRIIMITGDYGLTAESIAHRIGILKEIHPRVLTGADIEAMDDGTLNQALQGEVIFARASPEHKLRIVNVLQQMGHLVAVTGDGVNDAPALKKADIGIAMGLSGTDVAREASDMILLDDNFASIVNAIEEGRAVYSNIKKFSTYIFTSNTPEAIPFILFALSRGAIPLALNVMHILAIDLGTDLVPALALGGEPPEPGIMDTPPRSLKEHVITPSMLVRAYIFLGPIQSAAVMAAFYFQYWTHGYEGQWLRLPAVGPLYESATAMALACVVTTQIGNLFAQRTEFSSVFHIGLFSNRLLWAGILTELFIVFAIVYFPPVQNIIGTKSFPLQNWAFLFACAPLLLFADEFRKALLRWKKHGKANGGHT